MERVSLDRAFKLTWQKYWKRLLGVSLLGFLFLPAGVGLLIPAGVFMWTWLRLAFYDVECSKCEIMVSGNDNYCRKCGEEVPEDLKFHWGNKNQGPR